MDKSIKRDCYIIYMEDDHNLRTAVAVCLSKRNAEQNRDVLAQNNYNFKFIIEECILVEPIHVV